MILKKREPEAGLPKTNDLTGTGMKKKNYFADGKRLKKFFDFFEVVVR